MTRSGKIVTAGAAVCAMAGLTALPAQAAVPTSSLTLKCQDQGSTRKATMKVSLVAHEADNWEITRTDYSTAPSPGWNADEVRLMAQPAGSSNYATLHTWGTLSKANTVATKGGSNSNTWPGYENLPPIVQGGVDHLKMKLFDSGHYYDCTPRPVPPLG